MGSTLSYFPEAVGKKLVDLIDIRIANVIFSLRFGLIWRSQPAHGGLHWQHEVQ